MEVLDNNYFLLNVKRHNIVNLNHVLEDAQKEF